MRSEPLLSVENISKSFGPRRTLLRRGSAAPKVLDDVSFAIHKGETLGLVGESGSGKTTLGRCITLLDRPDAGRVVFEGRDLTACRESKLRPIRRHLQTVFQDPFASLNPRKTAATLIGDAFRINGLLTKAERSDRVSELLALVGLRPEQAHRFPHEFSGGQRQRIAIARALALRPKLVVADEPVSALDISIQAQIMNLMIDLQGRFQLTFLFISHDLNVVRLISNRVIVMYLGRIVETGPTDEVFRRPRHHYTRALIDAIPQPDPRHRGAHDIVQGEVDRSASTAVGCAFHPRCRARMPRCAVEKPGLRDVINGHAVACFAPVSG